MNTTNLIKKTIGITGIGLGLAVMMACGGGGGGEELSPEEYFSRYAELSQGYVDDTQAGVSAFQSDFFSAGSDEEGIGVTADYLEANAKLAGDFGAALDDLNPPGDAADAHDELVSSFDEISSIFSEAADSARDADSGDDIQSLLDSVDSEVNDVQVQANQSTCALQDVADQNGVDIDLGCGG